ncbi:MAG: cytosolic protein [Anaerolineales bacterium]|nr:cytosolic protein [Anaerolineales bacterium]
MKPLNLNDVTSYVEEHIGVFHTKRLEKLSSLKLDRVLKRKNPYLFKAKNILTAQDLVKSLLDAYLSSQEETIFGEFLENLAIFVNAQVYGGAKSAALGIDLLFEKDETIYIVAIKSGPNWGNSDQKNRMLQNFKAATRTLKTNNARAIVQPINGCCYGIDNKPDKGDYQKLCGQRFWEFISGNVDLYTDIIEPLGHKAKEKNDEFMEGYAKILNMFTLEFMNDFCDDGIINWNKLVKYNSGKK